MKTDIQIQADVQNELNWVPQLYGPEIGVTVKNGIVTLTGTVSTYAQKLAAEAAAVKVAGVRAVAEEIKVAHSFSARKTDQDIAQAILNTLSWYTNIDESRIHAKVENGVVTLEGQVDWDYQRRAARSAVENLQGVLWINNNITIKPASTPADIRARIVNAFERNAAFDADKVHVEVAGSKVILTGNVRSLVEKFEASSAAWSAPGIATVENHLEVTESVPVY
jgi:osmotically-inducible protein OsmY